MHNDNVDKTIHFDITEEQAIQICNFFEADIAALEDKEICELLDQLIDMYCFE